MTRIEQIIADFKPFFCFKIRENRLISDLIRVLLPLIFLFGSGLFGLESNKYGGGDHDLEQS